MLDRALGAELDMTGVSYAEEMLGANWVWVGPGYNAGHHVVSQVNNCAFKGRCAGQILK